MPCTRDADEYATSDDIRGCLGGKQRGRDITTQATMRRLATQRRARSQNGNILLVSLFSNFPVDQSQHTVL